MISSQQLEQLDHRVHDEWDDGQKHHEKQGHSSRHVQEKAETDEEARGAAIARRRA
jgi:hypothetical protein